MKIRTSRTLAKRWAHRVEGAAHAYSAGVAAPRSGKPRENVQSAIQYAKKAPGAKSKWAKAWEPYRKILLGLKLPPRGPVRSEQNYERVRVICEALHAEKVRRERSNRKPKVSHRRTG